MVSLLSFFTGKKKSRRAPSPPPTTGHTASPTAGLVSPNRARSSRFLSLRHKGTGRLPPPSVSSRRASSEVARKRSQRKKDSVVDLPRLALNWETGQDGRRGRSSLGLEGMGKPPRLESDERRVLDDQRFGWDEVVQGWKWFGKAFRDAGLDTPGIMLPGKATVDQDNQHLLLALFTLAMTPSLADRFPSLDSYYQSISSDHDQPQPSWSARLSTCISDTLYPADLAECLKYILRRLDPPASGSTSSAESTLTPELYKSFVKAEKEAGYPLDAYEKLFVPRIPVGMRVFLDEVFDLCAAVAAHSDNNGLSGSKLIGLLGWWIWGCSRADPQIPSWDALYQEWSSAWKRVEHLFFAWIRNQSIRSTLPTRLMQLVDGYPFGEISGSTYFLPSPPPSSFYRHALHVTLTYSVHSPDHTSSAQLLEKAVSARIGSENSLPVWKGLETDHVRPLHALVEEDSLTLLGLSAPKHVTDNGLGLSHSHTSGNAVDSIGRPLSIAPSPPPAPRQRSASHDDGQLLPLGQPIPFSSLGLTSTSPESEVARRPSTNTLQLHPTRSDSWDAFKDSGFGPTLRDELELSPRMDTLSPLSATYSIGGVSDADYAPVRRVSNDGPGYVVDREEVIEIDDLFLPFIQDGQQDPATTSRWPSFALVRLRAPVSRETGDLEWLLVTAEYRPPPTSLESPPSIIERPSSPTESTINKSLGFFRRSSSYGGKTSSRRSLFSTSRNGPRASASTFALSTLTENALPSRAKSAESLPSATLPTKPAPTDLKPREDVNDSPATVDKANSGTGDLGPVHTTPGDWAYRAEGGAHLIFTYVGSSPRYKGRVLRIRKPTSPVDAHDAARILWKEKLLPKMLPSQLLLSSQAVDLDVEWVKALLCEAERARPESRKNGAEPLADTVTGPVKGSIMDDTTAVSDLDTDTILSIEIKPKWGFLPRAEFITPPEAAPIKSQISRYVLHRHYKNEPTEDAYDPQDLYSENEERVKTASEALWRVWETSDGLKNNWRVYLNGQVIKPSQADRLPFASSTADAAEKTLSIVLPELLSSTVFAELKRLQSTLDPVDISTLASRFQRAHPNDEIFDPALIEEPDSKELEAFVEKYLENPARGVEEDGWTLREHMIAYALSAIFKDCSIFIAIPLAKEGDQWTVKPGTKVKIIDLDLKDVKSLRKWYDVDRAIWVRWLETHGTADECRGEDLPKDQVFEDLPEAPLQLSPSPEEASNLTNPSTRARQADALTEHGQGMPTQPSFETRTVGPQQHDDLSSVHELEPPPSSQAPVNEGESVGGSAKRATSAPVEETTTTGSRELEHATEDDVGTRPSLASETDVGDDEDSRGLPSSISEGRQKRSLAPSPSPTPFRIDLPEGLVSVPQMGDDQATAGPRDAHHVDEDKNGSTGLAMGLGLGAVGAGATIAAAANVIEGPLLQENGVRSGESAQSVKHDDDSTEAPGGVPQSTSEEASVPMEPSSSDESGRMEEFVTPMAEMPESSVAPAPVDTEGIPADDAHSATMETVEQSSSMPTEHTDAVQPITAATSVEVIEPSSQGSKTADAAVEPLATVVENDRPSERGNSSATAMDDSAQDEDGGSLQAQIESPKEQGSVEESGLKDTPVEEPSMAAVRPVDEGSSPLPEEPAGVSLPQLSLNATSVTGEELLDTRLPDIATIATGQSGLDGASDLDLDKVDNLHILPRKNDALLLATFEPHSLPPVLERGESTLAVAQSDPVPDYVPHQSPAVAEQLETSMSLKAEGPSQEAFTAQDAPTASHPAISIDNADYEAETPVVGEHTSQPAVVDDSSSAVTHLAVQPSEGTALGTPSLASDNSGIIDDSVLNTPMAEQSSSVGSFHLSIRAGSVRSDPGDTEREADRDAVPLDRTDTLAAA